MEKKRVDGIHDNAEISWNGRAFITSDISNPVLFNIFFDSALPETEKRMLLSINETNRRGEDLGDVIPCDCLNVAAIYALKNQIFDEWNAGCKNADEDGCLHGEIPAETIVPSCVHEAADYLAAVGYQNNLLEGFAGMKISWKWQLEVCVDGEDAKLTDLEFSAVKKILEDMLDGECFCGMW